MTEIMGEWAGVVVPVRDDGDRSAESTLPRQSLGPRHGQVQTHLRGGDMENEIAKHSTAQYSIAGGSGLGIMSGSVSRAQAWPSPDTPKRGGYEERDSKA